MRVSCGVLFSPPSSSVADRVPTSGQLTHVCRPYDHIWKRIKAIVSSVSFQLFLPSKVSRRWYVWSFCVMPNNLVVRLFHIWSGHGWTSVVVFWNFQRRANTGTLLNAPTCTGPSKKRAAIRRDSWTGSGLRPVNQIIPSHILSRVSRSERVPSKDDILGAHVLVSPVVDCAAQDTARMIRW